MKPAHTSNRRPPRRPTNVSLDPELVAEARALDINLSQAFETHLAELVRARRAEAWMKENAKGFDAYNRFVETAGIWNEDDRGW